MSSNTITLDKALVDRITALLSDQRRAVKDLAILAAELKLQYQDTSGKFDKTFKNFWNINALDTKFGSLSNFSKYALSGEGIKKVLAQYEQYETKLPTSLAALYEFSQLSSDEMGLCLENTFSRKDITQDRSKWTTPKGPRPLITPTTTAAAIKNWRLNWRNPRPKNTDKRTLPIAEIKLHGSLYEFKNGAHSGKVTLEDVATITRAIQEALSGFDSSIIRIDFNDERLKETYLKRESDAIKKAETDLAKAKKKPEKKSKISKRKFVKHLRSA